MAKHYDAQSLFAMFDGLALETTIAKQATFRVDASDLPLVSIRKALTYGFQRWLNDRVGGSDLTPETKIAETELFLATVLDGSWIDGARTRKAPIDVETNVRRKVVLAALSKADRKTLAEMDDEKRVAKIDALWLANTAKLLPVFEEEMAAIERKASLAVSGISL